jgi:transposase-like protein
MSREKVVSEEEWRIRFEKYKQSGLSIKSWCAKNKINASTLHYWIKKFDEVKEQNISPPNTQFAEVALKSDNTNDSRSTESKKLFLSYGSYTVGIEDSFNPVTLAELLKVLQNL